MNALDGNFFAIIGRINQDLKVTDRRLTRHHKEIEVLWSWTTLHWGVPTQGSSGLVDTQG